jgi:hypothetical protein
MPQPWRILYRYGDAPTTGFSFPPLVSTSHLGKYPVITLFALLGMAPVLASIIQIDPQLVERLIDQRARLRASAGK